MSALFITLHDTNGTVSNINVDRIDMFLPLITPTLKGGQTVIYCNGDPTVVTESVDTIRQRIDKARSFGNYWKE